MIGCMAEDPSNTRQLAEDVQAALTNDLTIDITTVGRQSGESQRIEIWFLHVGGVIYITGTPGPRDWFANLAANRSLTFHLKESVTADLEATASIVSDIDERRGVIESMVASWYREQVSSQEMLDTAPMVRITFANQI